MDVKQAEEKLKNMHEQLPTKTLIETYRIDKEKWMLLWSLFLDQIAIEILHKPSKSRRIGWVDMAYWDIF